MGEKARSFWKCLREPNACWSPRGDEELAAVTRQPTLAQESGWRAGRRLVMAGVAGYWILSRLPRNHNILLVLLCLWNRRIPRSRRYLTASAQLSDCPWASLSTAPQERPTFEAWQPLAERGPRRGPFHRKGRLLATVGHGVIGDEGSGGTGRGPHPAIKPTLRCRRQTPGGRAFRHPRGNDHSESGGEHPGVPHSKDSDRT
jgi:hypothetical protein